MLKIFRTTCLRGIENSFLINTKSLKCVAYQILSKKQLERVQIDLIHVPRLISTETSYPMTCKDHFSRYAAVYLLVIKL